MGAGNPAEECPVRLEVSDASEVSDGLVLFQGGRERVHYLNRTASLVFELCTGANSVQEIAGLIGDAFGLPEPPLEEVRACLGQLREQGVVR